MTPTQAFYQTFYQHDQLYRLPDDPWLAPETVAADAATLETDTVEPPTLRTDLTAELDALSASVILPADEPVVAPTPVLIDPDPSPEPVTLVQSVDTLPASPPVLPVQPPALLNHKVLLLADEALDPSNLLFLEKILNAVNLNIDGVDLLNLNGVRDVDFAEMVQGKHIHHFITFGVPFNRLHLDIAMDRYQPVRFFGITFLMADSLPTIEADQHLKRRLWNSLKQMFLQA